MRVKLAILATPLVLGATVDRAQAQPVDTIYVNGTVITVDALNRTMEAVAVTADRIVATGDTADIRRLSGPDTHVVDLAGKTMLPGFYAPHDHFPGSGMSALFSLNLGSPPMGPIETMENLVTALKQRADETPAGEWVRAGGYDDTLLAEKRHPTREDLDRASTEHPIAISHTSGHLSVVNTLALELSGITRATPDPAGGVLQRDPATGEPNGVLEESARQVIRGGGRRTMSQDDLLAAIAWSSRDYVEDGVTTAVVTGSFGANVEALESAANQEVLQLRIIAYGFSGTGDSSIGPPTPQPAVAMVKRGGIKMIQDGSNQGFTGYFTEPYHTPFRGDPSYRGYPSRSREELTDLVKALHRAGHQIAIHGNGDAAIDDIIHAYREAQREFPRPDARHRIEHCQMVRKDQLDQIAELNITPSFFVGHVFYWGDRHRDIFMGPTRAAGISPLRSALDRGIRFTVHDDTPVTPVDPLHLMWVSVNRRTRSNQVLGPDERVTPVEALRAMTIDAAWQNFEEEIKGSIEIGKVADFAILADNPLTVDPATIKDIEVLETIVGGKTVYRAGTSDHR